MLVGFPGTREERWRFLEATLLDTWFFWPPTFEQGFLYDEAAGRFAFTADFTAHVHDLGCWRTGNDFVKEFPAFESVCLPLSKIQKDIILCQMKPGAEEVELRQKLRKRVRRIEGSISLRIEEIE